MSQIRSILNLTRKVFNSPENALWSIERKYNIVGKPKLNCIYGSNGLKGVSPVGEFTALHGACYRKDTETAKFLISIGVDLNEVNSGGWTALMMAGNSKCFKILLEAGADPNICLSDGTGPLFIACDAGNIGDVEMLLTPQESSEMMCVDVNKTNNHGESPLNTVFKYSTSKYFNEEEKENYLKISEILVKAGAVF